MNAKRTKRLTEEAAASHFLLWAFRKQATSPNAAAIWQLAGWWHGSAGSSMKKINEATAWGVIASLLERRETELAYQDQQPSLCVNIARLLTMGAITRVTWCRMLARLRTLYAPRLDMRPRSMYWDRHYRASRHQRILAAWFLHEIAKRREPI